MSRENRSLIEARHTPDDLRQLIAEFEQYLADDKAWSRRRFVAFHARFKAFGVGLDTAISDEILGQAKRRLPEGAV